MKNGESFIIELCPEQAPITCENFLKLVKSGFYNGLTFHRVIDGFMAQGGDPEGTGCGGSNENIKGEMLNLDADKFDRHILEEITPEQASARLQTLLALITPGAARPLEIFPGTAVKKKLPWYKGFNKERQQDPNIQLFFSDRDYSDELINRMNGISQLLNDGIKTSNK